jgi:hypothetical protein
LEFELDPYVQPATLAQYSLLSQLLFVWKDGFALEAVELTFGHVDQLVAVDVLQKRFAIIVALPNRPRPLKQCFEAKDCKTIYVQNLSKK